MYFHLNSQIFRRGLAGLYALALTLRELVLLSHRPAGHRDHIDRVPVMLARYWPLRVSVLAEALALESAFIAGGIFIDLLFEEV